ncbi:MAG TPA: iron-containing redox enzyme family protein [Ramlibacter sp.]|nr:iron-containing redox enzyme family protein [Ramlibacter sp.]
MAKTFKKDILPGLIEECTKYMHASKWYNLEKLEPGLVKLWIEQLSLWTRSAFKVRGHVYAHCPHPEIRLALLDVVGEEDVEDPRIGMNHRQLLVTSLGKASGWTLQELENAKPLPALLVTFEILFAVCKRTWIEGIALTAGMERMLQECGYFKLDARRLMRDAGWSEKDVAWFSGHDEADEEHGALIELLDKYITDDAQWELVREAVLEGWMAWWIMLDGVADAYKHGIKPVEGLSSPALSKVF